MDVREKLVELIRQADHSGKWMYEQLADHLIANGVTVQEWISVKDRLPEGANTVLAVDSDGTTASAYYVGNWHSGGDLEEDDITHWMPLPEPPKEVE